MDKVFLGFLNEGKIKGCSRQVIDQRKLEEVHNFFKKMQSEYDNEKAIKLYSSVKWIPYDPEIHSANGSLFFGFLKNGNLKDYLDELDNVFKKLTKNGMENEDGTVEKIDYSDEFNKYVSIDDGVTKVVFPSQELNKNDSSVIASYILDLDKGECKITKYKEPFFN